MSKWKFQFASTWDPEAIRDPNNVFHGKPSRDQQQFDQLLADGWEPIGAWGKAWGSAYETVVALKKKSQMSDG
jgi:hypothetical protein